jgi:hypothetical protein
MAISPGISTYEYKYSAKSNFDAITGDAIIALLPQLRAVRAAAAHRGVAF